MVESIAEFREYRSGYLKLKARANKLTEDDKSKIEAEKLSKKNKSSKNLDSPRADNNTNNNNNNNNQLGLNNNSNSVQGFPSQPPPAPSSIPPLPSSLASSFAPSYAGDNPLTPRSLPQQYSYGNALKLYENS